MPTYTTQTLVFVSEPLSVLASAELRSSELVMDTGSEPRKAAASVQTSAVETVRVMVYCWEVAQA